jgi:hypothetical protein
MECELKCECGALNGTATLEMIKSRPTLCYSLNGRFVVGEKGLDKGHPICIGCKRPALTRGNWK